MGRKKKIITILTIFLLVLTVIFYKSFLSQNTKKLTTNTIAETQKLSTEKFSLKEAYSKALKEAMNWNKDSKLVIITSVDDDEKELAGISGKRKKWNLIFANLSTEETLQISIDNGEVKKFPVSKEKTVANVIINPDSIQIDSTEIIEKAKKDFKLKPGTDWANGFHFSLMNNGKQTYMTVTGLNQDDKFTQIYYDSKTGTCIGSKVQPN
ncbi:4'-phosphopantetheinyl transferase superfamily protein [Clostridium sp. YIM B02505]|uniref:4'-phosphopantetheinyl transferase superfamily protein n=1 Tax=Clostridium yunnanense TaxID=2800325 RepID=A0ABS1EQD2_9CLOT|nr:4'-phosphopantetheinyl transferase superfamily protein [Clostridium yunnanense]MBK1811611.1 4'-phosphopantetheinyl transferase superfamily protein [Clostridium yunnanense]